MSCQAAKCQARSVFFSDWKDAYYEVQCQIDSSNKAPCFTLKFFLRNWCHFHHDFPHHFPVRDVGPFSSSRARYARHGSPVASGRGNVPHRGGASRTFSAGCSSTTIKYTRNDSLHTDALDILTLSLKSHNSVNFFRNKNCRISDALLAQRCTCNFYLIANLQLSWSIIWSRPGCRNYQKDEAQGLPSLKLTIRTGN